jgi:hypothetical protein
MRACAWRCGGCADLWNFGDRRVPDRPGVVRDRVAEDDSGHPLRPPAR